METLRVLQLNCQGLQNKTKEIENSLERNNIDVAVLNETKILNKTPPTLSRWNLAALTRHRHHGTMVFVKKGITYNEELVEHTDEYELVKIRINTLTITATYVRPNANIETNTLKAAGTTDHLIVGDLNAHNIEWGGNRTNPMGETVSALLDEGYVILNDTQPTHCQGSVLDYHIATKQLAKKLRSFKVEQKLSDHYVTLSYFGNTTKHVLSNRIDWKSYRKEISRNLKRQHVDKTRIPSTIDQVEQITAVTEDLITNAKRRSQKPTNRTTLPTRLVTMMKERRSVRRRRNNMKKSNNIYNTNYLDLTQKLNRLTKKIKNEMSTMKREKETRIIENSNQKKDPALFWKTVKQLLQANNEQKPINILFDGNILESNQDKANAFATHLAKCNKINPSTNNWSNQLETEPMALSNEPPNDELKDKLVMNVDQIEKILMKKKQSSSPGEDGVTYKDLLQAPADLKELLCNLLTGCLTLGVTPTRWKTAVVKMIPKPKKDASRITNYRPISLISCLGKILETKFKNELLATCMNLKILDDHQYAFLPNRGTQDSLTKLTNDIAVTLTRRSSLAAAFLDVEKAFDSVWHKGLLYKMAQLQIPSHLIKWTRNYLEGRTVKVNVNGAQSQTFEPSAGLPQGSTISPLLYIIYTTRPEVTRCSILQFADDIALTNTWKTPKGAANGIEKGLAELDRWCDKWRVKLNPEKTSIMIFTRKKTPMGEVQFKGTNLKPTKDIKFLGITLQPQLQWNQHIKAINSKMRSKISQLPLLKAKGIATSSLTLLYKGLIRPHIGYCTTAWANIPMKHLKTLQTTQNAALRTILGKPKWTPTEDLHSLTRTPLVKDFLRRLNKNYMEKAAHHGKKTIILHLENVDYLRTRSKWRTPMMAVADDMG